MKVPANKIVCWNCNGSGSICAIFKPFLFTCDRCEGTGKCLKIMKEWEVIGKKLKSDRISRRVLLKDEAENRNISIEEYSKMERGIIKMREEEVFVI